MKWNFITCPTVSSILVGGLPSSLLMVRMLSLRLVVPFIHLKCVRKGTLKSALSRNYFHAFFYLAIVLLKRAKAHSQAFLRNFLRASSSLTRYYFLRAAFIPLCMMVSLLVNPVLLITFLFVAYWQHTRIFTVNIAIVLFLQV